MPCLSAFLPSCPALHCPDPCPAYLPSSLLVLHPGLAYPAPFAVWIAFCFDVLCRHLSPQDRGAGTGTAAGQGGRPTAGPGRGVPGQQHPAGKCESGGGSGHRVSSRRGPLAPACSAGPSGSRSRWTALAPPFGARRRHRADWTRDPGWTCRTSLGSSGRRCFACCSPR